MPIPGSGTISATTIQTEFGGANPISISEYYRGGGLVPNTGTNAGIPTSGQISYSQFYGSSAVTVSVNVTARTVSVSGTGTQTASISFANNGSNGYTNEWLNPNPQATTLTDDYEILATVVSGTLSSGTAGSWLNLGTTRSWTRNRSLVGTTSCTVNFKIRLVGSGTNLCDVNITLSATVEDSGGCVTMDSHLSNGILASEAKVGDVLAVHTPEDGFHNAKIEDISDEIYTDCVRIVTESGASLKCSTSTPFNLKHATSDLDDDSWVWSGDLLGHEVIVSRFGDTKWEKVVAVEDIGKHFVRPISVGGKSFAAGETLDAMIYSHNTTKVIP